MVVLVEGSDLERADAYKVFSTSEEWSRLRKQALAWTDTMVGRLLAGVDSSRDAVVVVGPSHPANTDALTVAAVKAPGVKPGLLQSGTTRRAGLRPSSTSPRRSSTCSVSTLRRRWKEDPSPSKPAAGRLHTDARR